MRRIPIGPLILVAAVVVWLLIYDKIGCDKIWDDFGTFAESVIHGKPDGTLGQKVLGEIGTAFKVSFNRTTSQVHMASSDETVKANSDWDSAVVMIKGDKAEGTGFLVHMPDGPAVVTNLHVLSSNPHFHVMTSDGREIPILSLRGASDRDLALLSIQDDHYHYLDMASDDTVDTQTGDEIITPGNSEGGEVTLDTPGKVLGLGPDRIEISNPIYHGNSGGPVVEKATGKVVGVVTFAMTRTPTDLMDQASRANPNSAITSDIRYFGLRLDTVPQWQPYTLDQFTVQANFLENFHENSVCLDSIFNGARYEKSGMTSKGAPDSKYFMHNSELAAKIIPHMIDDPEHAAYIEDVRVAILDLIQFGQRDLDSVQNSNNFYSFEWKRAQEEAAYRKALLKEAQAVNDKIN